MRRDKDKSKVKRKRGKKFVYKAVNEEEKQKLNPFETVSHKKFKKSVQSKEVANEYDQRFSSNQFIDRRIGEGSKNLSKEEKMKLRFKAQQIINYQKKKNKFDLNNDAGEWTLTHKGVDVNNLNDLNDDDFIDDDEAYDNNGDYQMDKPGLSRKEMIQNMIHDSKLKKIEKQRVKNETKEKIDLLDDNFTELNSLLKKRERTYLRGTDNYDKYANIFLYTKKTTPTDRIKTAEEIELEKEKKKARLEQKGKRDLDDLFSEDEEENEKNEVLNNKQLTKKERIEKLIESRLNKNKAKNEENKKNENVKKKVNEEKDDYDIEDDEDGDGEDDYDDDEDDFEEGEEDDYDSQEEDGDEDEDEDEDDE